MKKVLINNRPIEDFAVCGPPGSYESRIGLWMPPHWATVKGPNYEVDACIATLIEKLVRSNGVRTRESCCGHGTQDGYIMVEEPSYKTMLALGFKPDTYGNFILPKENITHIGPARPGKGKPRG